MILKHLQHIAYQNLNPKTMKRVMIGQSPTHRGIGRHVLKSFSETHYCSPRKSSPRYNHSLLDAGLPQELA